MDSLMEKLQRGNKSLLHLGSGRASLFCNSLYPEDLFV